MPAEAPSSTTAKPKKNGDRKQGDLRGGSGYLPDIHRLLPQSPDAEKGLIGSILLSPRDVLGDCVEGGITGEHFHIPAHAVIYNVLLDLWNANQAIDFITLTQILKDRNKLDEAGGAALVTELFTFVPTAANATKRMFAQQSGLAPWESWVEHPRRLVEYRPGMVPAVFRQWFPFAVAGEGMRGSEKKQLGRGR